MSKHSLARIVAILLLVLGLIVMIGGILSVIIFGSRGFGAGWSEGWTGWLTLPVMGLSCSTGFGLLMLGAILLLLVDVSRNLAATKVVVQKPAFVETVPAAVVTTIETPIPAPVSVEAPAVAPVVVASAAAATASAAAEPPPAVAAPALEAVVSAEESWTPRMAEEVEVAEPEPATIEFADSAQVGVPAPSAGKTARAAQIEIAEETVPELQAKPAPKKSRKRAAAATAAAAVVLASEKEPAAEDLSEIEASVVALKSGVDALEAPTEPQLPGAQEAARISAELAALQSAPKRQRKPAKLSLKLGYISAIGEDDAVKLNEIGVRTTEDLLTRGATRKGRQEIAEQTGIDVRTILTWVNHVDLFRIRGVGEEFAQLLELAGVDTVVELAQRNANNLQVRLVEVNDAQRLVRQVPVVTQVERWIEEAKTLPRVIKY